MNKVSEGGLTALEEEARQVDWAGIARRLEAAVGPDRGVDAEIYCALYGEDAAYCLQYRSHGVTRDDVDEFTASLDAAVTLVPEGWEWQVSTAIAFAPPPDGGRRMYAACLSDDEQSDIQAIGWTAALALCTGACTARQHAEQPTGP